MGNSYVLDGKIKNVKVNQFNKKDGSGTVLRTNFTFIHQNGNRTSFLLCDSWSKSIAENLKDGMIVELTNYIPYTESYEDMNGVKRTITKIEVKKLVVISSEEGAEDDFIDLRQQPKVNMVDYNVDTNQYERFTMPEEEVNRMVAEFNRPDANFVKTTMDKIKMLERQKEIIKNQPEINEELDGGHIEWT